MILYNLKRAIRNLWKNKLYSFLILGGFSVGFAATTLIGLFYFAEHRYNKDFPNYRRIYRVIDSGANKSQIDYNMFPVLAEKYPGIEDVCPLWYETEPKMVRNEQSKSFLQVNNLISTTNNFFTIFSVEIIGKLSAQPLNGNQSAVLTNSVAKALFGSQNPLGKKIRMGNGDFDVTAIINDLPPNSTFKAEIIINSENKSNRFMTVGEKSKSINPASHFILLKPGADPQELTASMNKTMGSYGIEIKKLALQNLSTIYFSESSMEDDYQLKGKPGLLRIFLAIALLIIILTSINYVNYTISLQYAKLKEIGIHKTHGSSHRQLAGALITEVSLGVLLSLLISVFLLLFLIPYSGVLFGKNFILNPDLLLDVLPFSILLILLIIAVNSIAPIFILSKFRINDFLLGSRKRKGKSVVQSILSIFQLTASIGLITGVLIMFKQVQFFKHADLGFDKELLLKIDFPPFGFSDPFSYRKAANAFREETAKLAFVKNAALSDGSAGNIEANFGFGKSLGTIRAIYADEDYLKTMRIKLLKGREFQVGDQTKVCLINEEVIRRFEWEDFEGKKFSSDSCEVIGVIKNFNVKSLHTNIDPVVIIYKPRNGSGKPFFQTLSVRLAPGNTGEQLKRIKQVWKNFVSNEPMNFVFYDDQFQSMYEKEERLAKSISFFSLVAIVLTCMGILGQIFMVCLNRVKEIGIRKVNGSKIWQILALLMKDFVFSILISFIIAVPIAYYIMSKWLENFAYKTTLNWWIFALAGVITLIITIVTVSWQSWKAATRNPVEALRYE